QAGWKRLDYETACYAAARSRQSGLQGKGSAKAKVPRIESVWLSPKVQSRLARPSLFLESLLGIIEGAEDKEDGHG
ncbi:MAG: hypothetical protein QXT58_05115, partial [Archaeoglobaceae archaeon]